MISFKEFLTESKSAPLYHATRMSYAGKILDDDVLLPSVRLGKYNLKDIEKAVSLTRSLNTARDWVSTKAIRVIFEIDQEKLSQKYKINPINMFHIWRQTVYPPSSNIKGNAKVEELFEEAIFEPIKPLSKYLKKVIFDGSLTDPYLQRSVLNHPLLYHEGKFVNK